MNPKLLTVKVVSNQALSFNTFQMVVHGPELIDPITPGQFAMVYPKNPSTLLPRPLSISDADYESLTFVYQIVGKGTEELSLLSQGDEIKILTPIGNGFLLDGKSRNPHKKVAIVGGGIGIAPLVLLAKRLVASGAEVDGYFGFREMPILQEEFDPILNRIYLATEIGHTGHRGNVVDVLYSLNPDYDEILACGPRPMLDALHIFSATKNIPTQVSMEERMACGLGTCVGCALKVAGTIIRICTEGPVFYSDALTN